MAIAEPGLATIKFWPRYVEVSPMASPKVSLSSRASSLSHGVAIMTAGGFGGGGAAGFGGAAAGFGGAGFGASAAGFAGCPAASLPGGGAASESPGFCSSAISVPYEESYTYHLRPTGVKLRHRGDRGGLRPRRRRLAV